MNGRKNRLSKNMLLLVMALAFLESFFDPEGQSLEFVLGWLVGNVGFYNRKIFLATVFRFLIPQVGIIALWGNYMHENVVFTRTRKSGKILWKYTLQLIWNVTITVVTLEGILCLVYLCKGCKLQSVSTMCSTLGMYCIYINVCLVAINILSLAIQSIFSILVILIGQLVSLEVTYHILQIDKMPRLYYVLPTSPVMFMQKINGCGHLEFYWAIYLLGIIILLFFAGCIYTEHKEFY